MREKILTLMSFTIRPLDQTAKAFVDEWRDALRQGFGEELPPDAANALNAIEASYKEMQDGVRDKIIAVYEKYFPEEHIDTLIAYNQSAAAQHLVKVGSDFQKELADALDEWKTKGVQAKEAELHKILGAGAVAATP